jgi:hypothetical protein
MVIIISPHIVISLNLTNLIIPSEMNSKSEAPMRHIFNVENPNWVKNHGGTEAKSTMRVFVYIRSCYNELVSAACLALSMIIICPHHVSSAKFFIHLQNRCSALLVANKPDPASSVRTYEYISLAMEKMTQT